LVDSELNLTNYLEFEDASNSANTEEKGWLQHDFHGIQLFIATMDQNEALGQVVQLYNRAKEKN